MLLFLTTMPDDTSRTPAAQNASDVAADASPAAVESRNQEASATASGHLNSSRVPKRPCCCGRQPRAEPCCTGCLMLKCHLVMQSGKTPRPVNEREPGSLSIVIYVRAKGWQKHTTGGIPRWSPTLVLVARFSAYVWQSGRDAQFSLTYGRMCRLGNQKICT